MDCAFIGILGFIAAAVCFGLALDVLSWRNDDK